MKTSSMLQSMVEKTESLMDQLVIVFWAIELQCATSLCVDSIYKSSMFN